VTKRRLWVLLPSLPFPLWNLNILEGITNTIGRFVAVDEDFHLSFDKRMAQVLVELDVSLGLPDEVEILCKERLLVQKLDYLHVPFRCSRCHDTGHLRRTCPLLLNERSCSSLEGSPDVGGPHASFAPEHPKNGIYSQSLSLFDDVSDSMLEALNELDNTPATACPSELALVETPPLVSSVEPSSPSIVFSQAPTLFLPPPSILNHRPSPSVPSFSSLVDFPPLPSTTSPPSHAPSPRSPTTSPSLSNPSLQKSLSIFSATTPSSPSTLHLNSIRFENVTVRKKKKEKKGSSRDLSSASPPYIPLSVHIKDAT